jgi:hypothetical protein
MHLRTPRIGKLRIDLRACRAQAAAVLITLLAVGGALSLGQGTQTMASAVSVANNAGSELKAWEGRWSALIAQRPAANAAQWNTLEKDLGILAKKYNFHTEDRVKKQASPKAATGSLSTCPPRDDIPGYRCYLFPSPKGVCRYVCTPTTNPGKL